MKQLFSSDITNIPRIISGLELYSGKRINTNTLLIFDEIQEVPEALSSLKCFYENAPEYAVISAGSLLGIALHQGSSFPVGKVEFMKLEPLTYKEFLLATGRGSYAELLENHDWDLATSYIDALREYYYVGGMPEAVASFSSDANYASVRTIQKNILLSYEQDFSKHAPIDIVPRIRQAWNIIPSQLAKENQKFIYGLIREGARAKEYEKAIMWLTDCALALRLGRVGSGELPLAVRSSMADYRKEERIINLPLYAIGEVVNISR
jgi:predicted AAA+ superfamily ATPase